MGDALKLIGFDIPGYQLRELVSRIGDPEKISFSQLNEIYSNLNEEKSAQVNQWKKGIVRVNNAYQVQGIAEHGADEIVHTIRIAVSYFSLAFGYRQNEFSLGRNCILKLD